MTKCANGSQHVRAGGLTGDFRVGQPGACHLGGPRHGCREASWRRRSWCRHPRARWQIHQHQFTCALRSAALRLTSMAPSEPDPAPLVAGVGPTYGAAGVLSSCDADAWNSAPISDPAQRRKGGTCREEQSHGWIVRRRGAPIRLGPPAALSVALCALFAAAPAARRSGYAEAQRGHACGRSRSGRG